MRRYITLLLALLLALFLAGCGGYTEEDIAAAKRSAYDEGYDAGYEDAERSGREQILDALDTGFEMAMSSIEEHIPPSYQDAYELGLIEGYWQGKQEAQVEIDLAYDEGYEDARREYGDDY